MPTYDTPGSVSLQIKLPSGRVKVTTADEPRTTVEVVSKGRRGPDALEHVEIRCEERHNGHTISIEQKDQFRWGPIQISWGGDIQVRITCPPGSDLELSAGSTDLEVEGELGRFRRRPPRATSGSRTSVASSRSRPRAATYDRCDRSRGLRRHGLRRHRHPPRRRQLSQRDPSPVTSGSARSAARSRSRRPRATSNLDSVEGGEVRLQTVSGDVRIGVGRGTRVWIDAASISGDLGSELGVGDDAPAEESDEVVPLHVKTVSGDVAIVRAARLLTRANELDDVVVAAFVQQLVHAAVPVEASRRAQDRVQPVRVDAGLASGPRDAPDRVPRLSVLELPGRVEPLRRARLAEGDELAVAPHDVELHGLDREPLSQPGRR